MDANRLLRSFVALVGIGCVCGTLLVGTDALTRAPIEANRGAAARALLRQLIGPLPADDEEIIAGQSCERWLFTETATQGYAGVIETLALWREGQVSMRVTRHTETPGIGTFIDQDRDPWMANHDGQSRSAWQAIDRVAGATVTTNAIKRAAETVFKDIESRCG